MTTEQIDEPRRRYERLLFHQPEYGDARDVQRIFGLRETFTYYLWRERKITGVSVTGTGKKRGKRLFNFDSIRKGSCGLAEICLVLRAQAKIGKPPCR